MATRDLLASDRSRIGITVDMALALPCLDGSRLVAGTQGRDRRIRVVNIMEVPDIIRWMRGGELLLTTAYPVRDDVSALARLIPELASRGVTALGVKLGPYLDAFPQEMLEAADSCDFPIIEIPPDVIFNDILSEVLGTILNKQAMELERSQTIHECLTGVALAGGSLQQLLGALSELIHLPVAIKDEHQQVIAAAGEPPHDTDHPEVLAPPEVTTPIKAGTSHHGEVVAWTGGEALQPHQLMAMERAATISAMAIAQERALVSREQRHRTLLLMELVSGLPFDRAEMLRRADAMGWELERPRAALLVELADSGGPLRVAAQPVEEHLVQLAQAAVPHSQPIVWALPTGLGILVAPHCDSASLGQTLHDSLANVGSGLRVMVASGRVYDDIADFPKSYQEAVETLTVGREIYGHDFALTHEDLGLYRLLYQLPVAELERHVTEELGPLVDYDERRGGSLLATLECYFRHKRNRVATAEQLNVHYNTLRYRLDQIERLTGGLDRTPTSRLQLETALHAHRVLAAKSRAPGQTK
ncbi:PucR family transcriptional regulator [Streptomyces sp. NPDC001698]|uniref:PucR family transcriptional regulator n=1 Tax=unclassified Streptomyces TaxID=2593676 RepID=UPI003676BCE6